VINKKSEKYSKFSIFFFKNILFEKGDLDSLMPVSRNQILIFGNNDPHQGRDILKSIIGIIRLPTRTAQILNRSKGYRKSVVGPA
jgi:hypothetical protein